MMHRLRVGLELLTQPRRLAGCFTGPKVLVASVPKAGTNMLMHVLDLVPQLTIEGTLVRLPEAVQLERLRALRPGRVVSTHMAPGGELDAILNRQEIKVLFISRDPRDVCVSLLHYIEREPEHYFHACYNTLADGHARLMAIITGHNGQFVRGADEYLPSVDDSFRRRLAWLDHPRCCAVTFEELVGPKGGGDRAQQSAAIRRIADHLAVRLTRRDIDRIADNVFSPGTSTFRRGQIGDWSQEMTAAHTAAFKRTAGQLLIDLGYEQDLCW